MTQALLIIDMQRACLATPRFQVDQVIANINRLANHFRANNKPVIFIQHQDASAEFSVQAFRRRGERECRRERRSHDHRRPRHDSARAVSRSAMRRLIVSRLSCAFLPRASPSRIFARPREK